MATLTRLRGPSLLNYSRLSLAVCTDPGHIPERSNSSNVVKGQTSNLAAYKRGRGGRSSFSGQVVTVLGCSGILGRSVVNRLGKIGSQVICPYRGDPYFVRDLKLMGDLGQILFMPFHLQDEESIRKVMKYSNVVINLVGRDWETKCFKYSDVNVDGARRIARIAREMGVEKLVHVSHINASPNPTPIYIPGGSDYLKTKYYGEMAVREEYPDAIVFRPSDIFGLGDRILQYYASMYRRAHRTLPLWKKGTQTIKSPVCLADVAEGIINSIHDEECVGKTYECIGPNAYYLNDMVDYIYRCMRWPNFKIGYITPMFRAKVQLLSNAPATPVLTMDKLDREHVSDEVTGHATLEDLGVSLTKLESRAPYILKPFRRLRHYEEDVGEFADPYPAPVIN